MTIEISKDVEQRLIDSIKRYFEEYMDSEIGDLKARLLLDFCLNEIGPSIYNKAISDAQAIMHDKVDDLDGSCYQPEFNFWNKKET
jgi:uncharacterized protein (DUF2164 family)